MITNYKVEVYNHLPATKVNGITIQGVLARVKDVYCDMQPYSKALLLKTYGYDLEVTKRIFFMDVDYDIKIGTLLYYTNPQNVVEKYEVKAIPWDSGFFEVVCNGI